MTRLSSSLRCPAPLYKTLQDKKWLRKPKREERKDNLSTVGYSVTVGRVLTSRKSYRQEAEGERYVGVSESMVYSPSVSGSESSRRMQSFSLDESHGA